MKKIKLTGIDGHKIGFAQALDEFKVYGEVFAVHRSVLSVNHNGIAFFSKDQYTASHRDTGLSAASFCDTIQQAKREVKRKARKLGRVAFLEVVNLGKLKIEELIKQ